MSDNKLQPDKISDGEVPGKRDEAEKRNVGCPMTEAEIARLDHAAAEFGAQERRPCSRSQFIRIACDRMIEQVLGEPVATEPAA